MKNGLKLLICVDWEGLELSEDSLQAMQDFKERWAIPLTHFMNPAYWTHNVLRKKANTVDFARYIKQDDDLGLHLHAPKHLIEAAGIGFHTSPSFAVAGDSNKGEFCGHEVMLHSYGPQDFDQLIGFSLNLLQDQGWSQPKSFRAGGWMMDPAYFSILQNRGIFIDSSSTPSTSLNGSCWQGESLQRYLKILWGDVTSRSQPSWNEDRDFLHIPNNWGAIDYWKENEESLRLQQALSQGQGQSPYCVITFHQETSLQYLPRLNSFLTKISDQCPVSFYRASEVAGELDSSYSYVS